MTIETAHLALLVHIENRVVDHWGRLDYKKIRSSELPLLGDLKTAGFITYDNESERYGLTELGWKHAHALRRLQAEGKSFREYSLDTVTDMDFVGIPDGQPNRTD